MIDRFGHRAASSVEGPAYAEAIELGGRRDHLAHQYRDEVTARDRFITDMAHSRRDRDRSLDRDSGLEL